jgi:hypothetical protein
MTKRKCFVYKGCLNGVLMYIGTTVQRPAARFRWHKANGKDLEFTVLEQHTDTDMMLDREFYLIKTLRPPMNKQVTRRQNLNVKLTKKELNSRKGVSVWCQGCLRRRVVGKSTHCRNCK